MESESNAYLKLNYSYISTEKDFWWRLVPLKFFCRLFASIATLGGQLGILLLVSLLVDMAAEKKPEKNPYLVIFLLKLCKFRGVKESDEDVSDDDSDVDNKDDMKEIVQDIEGDKWEEQGPETKWA